MNAQNRRKAFGRAAAGAMVLAAVLAGSGAARAQGESEPISVTVGKMEVITTPFPVEGFRVADKTVAGVEGLGVQQLRVMGLKSGTTDLQVTGKSGLSALYTITVMENIQAVFSALTRDLDTVPEVELSINLGRVLVKGEVSSIQNWNYLSKVMSMYGPEVVNLASFHPAPEVMLELKKALEKGGFRVQEDADESAPQPGMLSVKFSGNAIFIRGQVYSQRDLDRIQQIVSAQNWIAMGKEEDKDKDKGSLKVNGVLDIAIVPTMIELDSAFVGVTDVQEKQIGVNLAKAGLLLIDSTAVALRGTVGDSRPEGESSTSLQGSYVIGSGLEGALKFFRGSGPGRFKTAGHMTFKNDTPEWRSFHSGGTLKVRVVGRDAANLEDIDYGLIMRCKGGLIDPRTAELDVELELSYPVPVGFDYDLKRNKIATVVDIPLGHTLVMGGMQSMIEQTSNDGVPFLRSVPVVEWFFSEKNERVENSKVLILMSPQIAGAPKLVPKLSDETISTLEEAETPNKERERQKRGRRFFFF